MREPIPLRYGPSNALATLIVSNLDNGEGGCFYVHSGDTQLVRYTALRLKAEEIEDRIDRIAFWKKQGWNGLFYSIIPEFIILVIYADGTREDFSVPEEQTGL